MQISVLWSIYDLIIAEWGNTFNIQIKWNAELFTKLLIDFFVISICNASLNYAWKSTYDFKLLASELFFF